MKKSLIALAALAATGAFAQSSVTLSGNLDFAYGFASGTSSVKGQTVSTRDVTASTSVINIIAVEDLGGGMRATAKYGFDPRLIANNGNQSDAAQAGLARDEAFVGIEGGFGNLRLGSPNAIGVTSFLGASVLGTGVGSGYATVTNQMTHVFSTIRYDRSVRYDSPSFNGFTLSALYAPGNDQAVVSSNIPNGRKATELGLSYVNGPLNVSLVNISQASQTNAVATSAVHFASGKTSVNMINASYKVGSTTLVAGWNNGDTKGTATNPSIANGTATKTSGYRLGIRQDIGAVGLIAQYSQQTTGTTTEAKGSVTGLRADYSLSKTAVAYAAYEMYDTGVAAASPVTSTTGKRNIASFGLRKAF